MNVNDVLDFKIFKVKQLDDSFQYTFLNLESDGNYHLMKNVSLDRIHTHGKYSNILYLKKLKLQLQGKRFLEKN